MCKGTHNHPHTHCQRSSSLVTHIEKLILYFANFLPCENLQLTFPLLFLVTAEPLPLMDLCRRAARVALGRERLQEIESLPLPQSLKNYLQYQ